MKVSFDYDGTIERKDVQEYALELMRKGIKVSILTSRPNYKMNEVHLVADKLGIRDIHNTAYESKALYLDRYDLHVDNDDKELRDIEHFSTCEGVNVKLSNWKEIVNQLLNI
jgi:predicted mannosyl-3-phosphoglycerate phosphatase (HAD superfamily)